MALLMRLINQPLIIGHILTGILVGPSLLHLLSSPTTITTFSNIGIALLLFIIGLGLNPKVIKEVGKVAALTAAIQVVIIAGVGWLAGHFFGLSFRQAAIVGMALAFSSTIITLKLLTDKKEQVRLYGKITIGILIIQDVIAVFTLLFVTSQGNSSSISASSLGVLALKGLAAAALIYLITRYILPFMHKLIAGSQESLFLFAIGWGFGCAALFQGLGYSLEIGALIAGVALANMAYAQEISSRLRPLRDFFILVFFIYLGSQVNFSSFHTDLGLIVVATLIVILVKPIIIMATMGLMGYTKQTSFKTGFSLGQVSEFSLVLVLLGKSTGVLPANLVSVVTIVALISIAFSTYLINYMSSIYKILQRPLSLFERSTPQHEHNPAKHQYELVLFGYQKGGQEFIKLFQSMKKDFVVIDYDPEAIDIMEHQRINCIYGDATDIELLEEIGIEKAHLVVSTLTDHDINVFLLKLINKLNPRSIVILHAESIKLASELYELGASYVVIPHYIGNENIGTFIKNSDLKKSEFIKYQEKHLAYMNSHYALEAEK